MNKDRKPRTLSSISDALFDAYDIKNTLTRHQLLHLLKDSDGTEFTIGDCLDNIINILEEWEK